MGTGYHHQLFVLNIPPGQLLTAAHAEAFYMGASAWVDQVATAGDSRTGAEHGAWRSLLYLGGCPVSDVTLLRYVVTRRGRHPAGPGPGRPQRRGRGAEQALGLREG